MPWALIAACVAFFIGAGFVIGGVYLLFGGGWALIASAFPFFFCALVIMRGL